MSGFVYVAVIFMLSSSVDGAGTPSSSRTLVRSAKHRPADLMAPSSPKDSETMKVAMTSSGDLQFQRVERHETMSAGREASKPEVAQHLRPNDDSDSYATAVLGDSPVAYYRFNDNAVDAVTPDIPLTIKGNPTYVAGLPGALASSNKAIHLSYVSSGTPEEAEMADDNEVNKRKSGYTQRTVEFWFKSEQDATAYGNGGEHQTIYEEGGGTRGISVSFQKGSPPKLNIFMYNRKSGEKQWGTSSVASTGISCDLGVSGSSVPPTDAYYFAFVFDAENKYNGANDPIYKAYIAPYHASALTACGTVKHIGLADSKSDAWKSNVKLHKHGGDVSIGGVNGKTRYSGLSSGLITTHNPFLGTIDEFALYNDALSETKLTAHLQAGSYEPGPEPEPNQPS